MQAEETIRLSRQCQKILAELRRGPMSNRDLAHIALKYTSRISDLRQAGFQIECVEHDHLTGLTLYELIAEPEVERLPSELSPAISA